MATKHVHSEVIKAWADGAKIQFFNKILNEWEDLDLNPLWIVSTQYRVKPADPIFLIKNLDYSIQAGNYYQVNIGFYADENSAEKFINDLRSKMLNQK